jgi:hemolysin III
MTSTSIGCKPRLRGVFHELGFYASVGLGVPLVITAPPGRATFAAAVFAACVAGCFGTSALYHRPTWPQDVRRRLARVDHAAVYLLIAGTYTPVALIVMSRVWATVMLAVVWSGASAAMVLKIVRPNASKKVAASIGLGLGWVGVAAFSELLELGAPGLTLVIAGGLFYSTGAVVYARRRPNPVPEVFGYHEIFHALTLAGAACHYAAIAFFVLPLAD